MRQLKDFFGYSGYIGIAKSMVFLEGLDSSCDRKMLSSLFPEFGGKIKFIPSKTTENLPRINTAILSILENNIEVVQFYLIRDRDYLTSEVVSKYNNHTSGRMYVLNRYHIEKYLLDDDLIANVQTNIFGKQTDSVSVHDKLKSIALNISSEVLRDMVAYRINLLYRPEDFSLGKFMNGQATFDSNGNWEPAKIELLRKQFVHKVEDINRNLFANTTESSIEQIILDCQNELQIALFGDGEGWRSLIPGRRLLQEYARREGLGDHIVLQNSLIKELSTEPHRINPELRRIIDTISEGGAFSQ